MFFNIYLDELRGGRFLRENLVTHQSKTGAIIRDGVHPRLWLLSKINYSDHHGASKKPKNPLWGKDSSILFLGRVQIFVGMLSS